MFHNFCINPIQHFRAKEKQKIEASGQELNTFCIGNPLFPSHYF